MEIESGDDWLLWPVDSGAWLEELVVSVVDENRHSIASLISDTVRSWDAADTSKRIEDAIGRDLQFIRINGTIVGGLAGLAIYALVQAFGAHA